MNNASNTPRSMRNLHSLRYQLVVLLAVATPLGAFAAGQAVPDAGTILQQIKPLTPPPSSTGGATLSIERPDGARLPEGAPILVTEVRISGNTLFDIATLTALIADAQGKHLTFPQLGELAARITRYYHEHDYPLARAIIPSQVITKGIVRIQVIEARYDKVGLDNSSPVSSPLLEATLKPLQRGQPIDQRTLDRTLLLMQDIPGVVVGAVLKPGQATGTSDLEVSTTPGPAVTGSATLDNFGDRYTGRARLFGAVDIINPLHHGDVLSINALSAGSRLNFGRIAYESLLNGQGTRLGGHYTALDYRLGDSFAALDAHGTARSEGLWLRHPIVRSPDHNLMVQLNAERRRLRDRIDASAMQNDRRIDSWSMTVTGDMRDRFLSPAVSSLKLGWTTGRVDFDNADAAKIDVANAKTQGRYHRWNVAAARSQSLARDNWLYLGVAGQWANSNLDPSEKLVAGGALSVRAYDVAVATGDTGYTATMELRHNFSTTVPGEWQAIAFLDHARLSINQTIWTAGDNTVSLTGAGFGISWAGPNGFKARAFVATPIGGRPALLGPIDSVRAGVEIGSGF